MNTNLPLLFDLSKLEKRKTPIQKEFELSNYSLLVTFYDAVIRAFSRLHKEIFVIFKANSMDKNMPAVAMSSFIRDVFIQKFPEYCRHATKNRFKLITPNGEWAFIKKLNYKKRPQNIQTIANEIILHQYSSNASDKAANVFLGYCTTADNSRVTGVYAVCIEGQKQHWITDITSLLHEQKGRIENIQGKKKTKLKEGTVKIKKRKDN